MKINFKNLTLSLFLITLINPAFASMRFFNSSNARLGIKNDLKCSTGISCSVVGSQLVMTATSPSFTLENGEIMNNTVDDTIEFLSDDNHTTLQVTGFEAKDAILNLYADQGDDAADKFSLRASAADVLEFRNNGTALMSLSSSGDLTMAGTTPYLTIGDNGAEDSGIVFDDASIDFNISVDDSAGTLVIGKGTAAGTTDAMRVDTNQDVTVVKNLLALGDGYASGFKSNVVTATATTLTKAQCGSTFINSGAVQVELPEASLVVGCKYIFITANASNFDINPDGGDQILILTNSAGDAIRNATLGNSVVLEAINSSQWAPVGKEQGTYSDIN